VLKGEKDHKKNIVIVFWSGLCWCAAVKRPTSPVTGEITGQNILLDGGNFSGLV
jgi:hypothetical protein